MSGLSHVRAELLPLLVVPSLAPHPVLAHDQLTSHGRFGGLSSSPNHQVHILAGPVWQCAHRDLRRFHQQETHDRTPLFGDASQPSPFEADNPAFGDTVQAVAENGEFAVKGASFKATTTRLRSSSKIGALAREAIVGLRFMLEIFRLK
jgi:hypothetical protein